MPLACMVLGRALTASTDSLPAVNFVTRTPPVKSAGPGLGERAANPGGVAEVSAVDVWRTGQLMFTCDLCGS
ncbi:hypothetical protein BCR44DRAFT_1425186 [Catenaria anguillulae PL171]|uniref:Uncharacterized protein n=1 Tax=Catenaria anguillulae PL171 TaxID=765915 RepID=A0A1Y2I2P7_9FUNG|nr:hypothetical protein BCR44DRAFT_1425186 [Catenaria anguillulae PL171]